MNDFDPDQMEAELRRLRPARTPEDFRARLDTALTCDECGARAGRLEWLFSWRSLLRWTLAAGSAAALVTLLLRHGIAPAHKPAPALQASKPAAEPGSVTIDRSLVADFDAVAQTRAGAPVRFRCREWVDDIVLRDAARGVVIERRQPRMEVVPVSFETY